MKSRSDTNLVFQEILLVVLSLTLLSGGVSCWMASQPYPSSQQERIIECATTTWQAGVGVIFGLLGSKITKILQSEKDEDNK